MKILRKAPKCGLHIGSEGLYTQITLTELPIQGKSHDGAFLCSEKYCFA